MEQMFVPLVQNNVTSLVQVLVTTCVSEKHSITVSLRLIKISLARNRIILLFFPLMSKAVGVYLKYFKRTSTNVERMIWHKVL